MNDEWIYLEKKKGKPASRILVTESEETPRFIAQVNAIQLNHLLQYNAFERGSMVPAGTRVLLKPASSDLAVTTSTAKKGYHSMRCSQKKGCTPFHENTRFLFSRSGH